MLEVYNYHLRSLIHLHPFHPAQIFAKAINDLTLCASMTLCAPTGLFGGKPWGKRSGSVTSVGGLLGWRGVTGLSEPGYNGGGAGRGVARGGGSCSWGQ